MATIHEWQKKAYAQSKKSGFHDEDEKLSQRERLGMYLMNLHSEISELWEAFREGKLNSLCNKADKGFV